MRIFDNHFHLNYKSNYIEPVKIFSKAGGTSINLINLPPEDGSSFEKTYEETIRIGEIIRERFNLDVIITIGPYPVNYMWMEKEKRDTEYRKAIDRAINLIRDQKAQALGEIGRIHFEEGFHLNSSLNNLMEYAFQSAADIDCPVIIHSEDLDEKSLRELENMCYKNGIPVNKVVKHHANYEILKYSTKITLSIPAARPSVAMAVESGASVMLETDFINEPGNLNKFLPPDSVPLRAKYIINRYGENGNKFLERSFHVLPEMVYGEDNFHTI
ncbi:TatD family hydrolase [Caldiplasma sukawensis]